MKRLLMLDSGAFSVWTKGVTIDLDEYTDFCLAHPQVSYYVSLDVIPGRFGMKQTLRGGTEESCRQGWNNYRKMLDAGVPKKKLIPVFHQHDDVKWLDKYLDFGVPYIGVSPANDCTTGGKLSWLRSLRPLLFDGAGRPLVRTHGFAVTSYRLMQCWEWYSVDSATWQWRGSLGEIWLPRKTRGEFDYSKSPTIIAVSPRSPSRRLHNRHSTTLSPLIREDMDRYLTSVGLEMGAYDTVEESPEYKPAKGEVWLSRNKGIIARPLTMGVVTNKQARYYANAEFVKRMQGNVPVKWVYFAGQPMLEPFASSEYNMYPRLMSYHLLKTSKASMRVFRKHISRIIKESIA